MLSATCWSVLVSCWTVLLAAVDGSAADLTVEEVSSGLFDTGSFNVSHVIVDAKTGMVYAGAVNRLYRLSAELTDELPIVTGPFDDNPMCPPPPENCRCNGNTCKVIERTQLDSVTKAMIIDYSNRHLVYCTNLFQGHCVKYNLADMSQLNGTWSMIVPNDPQSSVVMFIAPGPADQLPQHPGSAASSAASTSSPANNNIIYVAATRSTVGLPAYKDLVPAVCMRNVEDFNLYSNDFLTPSKVDIEAQQRDTFRVGYVYGFASLDFSYFLTVQRAATDAASDALVSRVARVCQRNSKLAYTYAELPIECRRRGVVYGVLRAATVVHVGARLARGLGLADEAPATDNEHVLVAVFGGQVTGSGGGQSSAAVNGTSALCIYPVVTVRRKFTETIQKCFQGIGNTGPDHVIVPQPCIRTPFDIGDNYCGENDMNHPIHGTDVTAAEALMTWSGPAVTSLAVTVTDVHTVAFIGTESGQLKKVLIESPTTAFEYQSLSVHSRKPINNGMVFDLAQQHIYLTSHTKVLRVPVQRCSDHTSCADCLASLDPYCGWCTLESSCSLKSECKNSDAKSRWLPYDYGSCPKIASVEPHHVQKSPDTSIIHLTVQSLPVSPNSTYECVFTGYGVTRTTNVVNVIPVSSINTTLRCSTPAYNLLPTFPTGKDHIDMALAVRLPGIKDFLVTNFTFYDCDVHTSCTKCTDSDYPCKWCVKRHRCTNHVSSEMCQDDVMITGKQLPGNTDHPGPDTCPRIESILGPSEILVSSGKSQNITVKAVKLQDFQREFKCHFNFDGGVEVPGELVFDDLGKPLSIRCREVAFLYPGLSSLMNVPFTVMWLNDKEFSNLDNPHSVQVRMFKCAAMASNCGGCRRTDPIYNCGWHDESGQCCSFDECQGPSWFSNDQLCQNPVIYSVRPLSGPRAGGTSVVISGENLGNGANDTTISINGVRCIIIAFDPFVSYTCKTESALKAQAVGPVMISISSPLSTLTATSTQQFVFSDPLISGFSPGIGPVSGGTRITITGSHLDIGSRVLVGLSNGGTHVACSVTGNRSEDSIVCITAASSEPCVMTSLWMEIDSVLVNFSGIQTFEFTPDPVIESISSSKSIVSGGVLIEVRGNYFGSVSSPHIVVHVNNRQFTNTCNVTNNTSMYCRTPDLRKTDIIKNSSVTPHYTMVHYGFIMDNVSSVLDLSSRMEMNANYFLQVYPDPEFDKFTDDGVKKMFLPRNDYLTINGRNLNLVLTENDILVTIGDRECVVTSMSLNQLTCKPFYDDDTTNDIVPGSSTVVVVSLRTPHNLSYIIGELKYEGTLQAFFSLTVILALAGGGFVVLLIIVTALIAYKRKSRESNQVMKRMQNQMDVLEIRVAKECKEAFAELQTDMNEIAGEISGSGGIPFRSYRSFCMSVLFPGFPQHAHPVTQNFNCDESTSRGLSHFSQLLGVKTFLLLFIRTLEHDREFHMRDKVNVASLLSTVLQSRMEYHTDILKTLLAELIERAMESHNHPKLLLRRTDSVAEKMLTNWFTFLLYKFLRECAGEPLFMLFRAIKQQIDKGPVDMVTGEARYSLGEDKLIRQQIDYKQLTVRVTDPESQQEHHVRVLDCDTITQVKEKILDVIYKNTPFSHRPTKEELDLEWHTGVRSRYILKDEDVTTRTESGCKRLNTLSHYKVTDGTLLTLIPRQSSTSCYDLSNVSEKSSFQHRYEEYFSGSPASLTRSLSPNAVTAELENGNRLYHLVKPQDADTHKDCERSNKMVSEVYLTRLLTTKVTVQQFVDDLFETIFSTTNRNCTLPLAVKYMFDFLDDQALHHGITDPEVVHTWKSNILPLRFWVNVIKNPDFVFDVYKSNIVDSCLSVVAQTFMDCCSMSEHKLSKDSPSSKLLYAKDIPKYRKWVERFYQDIQSMPAISDQDMNAMLAEESRLHGGEFTNNAAVYQLYQYADKYFDTLIDVLSDDEFARNYHLSNRLQQVHMEMHPRV